MVYNPTIVKMQNARKALEADLAKAGLTQKELGEKLGGITQQAISGWLDKNRIPVRRLAELKQLFGPGSAVAEFQDWQYRQMGEEIGQAQAKVLRNEAEPLVIRERQEPYPRFSNRQPEDLPPRLRWKRAMPADLVPYCDRKIEVGASQRRIDYLSPNVAAEVKMPGTNDEGRISPLLASLSAFQLAVVRQALRNTSHPPRFYVLVLIVPPDSQRVSLPLLQRFAVDCGLLGLMLATAGTPEEAAVAIVGLEESAKRDRSTDQGEGRQPQDEAAYGYDVMLGGDSQLAGLTDEEPPVRSERGG